MVFSLSNRSKMRTKRRILRQLNLFAIAIISAFGISLSPATSVFATSIYDDAVLTTSNLTLRQPGGSGTVDLNHSLMDFMQTHCTSTVYDSFKSAQTDTNGKWAMALKTHDPNDPNYGTYNIADAYIYWSTSPTASASFNTTFSVTVPFNGTALLGLDFNGDPYCAGNLYTSVGYISMNYPNNCVSFACLPYFSTYVSNYPITYPSGYEGNFIPGSLDGDGDGLTLTQERTQGTSDGLVDSDEDGLSDLVESVWNPYYNNTFCKQSSPYTCADPDPTQKDLFIEIDWMNNGTTAFKPTSTQLGLVETMLEGKGIRTHFDLGDYGGGNELPIYSSSINWYETPGELDIHDFKYGGSTLDTGLGSTLPPQFAHTYREGVWRYMIYGIEEMTDIEDIFNSDEIAGGAEPAGDDVIIASENADAFEDHVYSTDRAKAGIIAHEIGHLLCLTKTLGFPEMSSDCEFAGIDSGAASSNYKSVMNYLYGLPSVSNLETINFSNGTNGIGDHDDWDAILSGGGMGAFIYSSAYDDPSSFIAPLTKNNLDNESQRDITSFITSKAQDRARNNSKTLQLNPELRRR